MALGDDLRTEISRIFRGAWTERDGKRVPDPEDLRLANDAVNLDATVLYADLAQSTSLVDRYRPVFAAEIYKTYLYCAAKIIRGEGGSITSYDGDRIMAVFLGSTKNSTAARTGLKINYMVQNIIQPALDKQYPKSNFKLEQTVGIDTSTLLAARTGIRKWNDIVWVGRAANYAAKLSTLSSATPTWITEDVYKRLCRNSKIGSDGKDMWSPRVWTDMNNRRVYCSTYWWEV